jgi:AcrR family transcriptional regulator
MPRPYTLGKRAAAVAETRDRILTAAIALYQERGVSGTSMQQVGRRADVAPGTVLNHFPDPDALARAVVDRLLEDLHVPGPEIFTGLETVDERLRQLARELSEFYERSEPWYLVYVREGGRIPAWADAEQRFFEAIDRLMQEALGELADNATIKLAVSTLLDPGVLGGLTNKGLTSSAAGEFAADILLAWLTSVH